MATREIVVNMVPGGVTPVIHVSQYDDGYGITANLIENSGTYTVPVGATVSIEGTKPDGHGYAYLCTYQDNAVVIPVNTQMTAVKGKHPCELVVRKEGLRVGSKNMIMVVEVAGLGEDTIISDTELPAIIALAQEQEEAAAASAASAETAAQELQSLLIHDTASGAVASFSDGADNIPMQSLVAEITPVQSGSGDPSPTNIRPISGRTGMTVTRAGKNLANFVDGYGVDTSGNVTQSATRTATIDPIIINENIRYMYSASGSIACIYAVWNGDTLVRRVAGLSPGTLINTSGGDRFYVCAYASADVVVTKDAYHPMVTVESADYATYEPYVGQTYPITWETIAGTVYGGTLDVVSGVLTVTHAGIRLTSTNQSWRSAGSVSTGTMRYYCTLEPAADASTQEIICSHARNVSGNASPWGTCFLYSGIFAMKNGDGGAGFSTLADFRTWLDENNLQVCYELATPQTYQLTPTEVRTLLGGNTIYTDAGDVSVEYIADTKLYIDNKIAELQALVLEN